ncbi:MAG: tetratricopeptide repeat protein, partial [Actinomycetota bacterium]|nr:tetratricopeptide repeat protein [Actinomycetota bacterium]
MKKHNTLSISPITLAKAFWIFMIIFFLFFSLSGCSSLLEGKKAGVTNSTGIPANSDSDENATSNQTNITNGVTTSIIAAKSGNSNGSGSSEDPASIGQSTISETAEDNQKNDTSDSKTENTGNTNDLETQRYYFELGIKSFEEAKYVEAQYYLEKIKSDYIILADYIKFYIAKSMLLQKKYDMAVENYRNLIDNFPQSIFQEKATIELGDAYYLKKDFVKAAGQYKIFQTKFPDSGLIPYSLFQSGVCKEKNSNFEEAYADYKNIYIKYPESDYAKYACENLARLSEQNGLPAFIPTVDELYARAEKLFSIYYYDMALADFNKIIASSDASNKYPDIYSKTLFKTGMCYFNMNDYANSKKYLDMNYERFPTGGYADDSLYYLGRCLTNLNASNEAIQTYKMLLEKFPQSNYADDSLYRCGRISYMADDWQNAAFYYQRVIDEYPGGDKLPDVYWELGWIQYRLEEFDSALITFDKMSVSFKGTSLEEKSLFWKAKCLQKLDKQSEAIEIYKKIFSINALSYYGFASAKALEIIGNPVSMPVIDKNLNPENQNISKIIPEIYNELIPPNITNI